MQFSAETVYDAELDEVVAVETDQQVYEARFAEAGDRDFEFLEFGPDGDGWSMRNRRTIDVDLPGFASKVMSPTNTIEHKVHFEPERDGRVEGTFSIDVLDAPVVTEGTILFESLGDGRTRHEVIGKMTVKVPLIGGKLAKWGKGDAEAQLEREFVFTRKALADD